jgi:hypothetical protein
MGALGKRSAEARDLPVSRTALIRTRGRRLLRYVRVKEVDLERRLGVVGGVEEPLTRSPKPRADPAHPHLNDHAMGL